MNLATVFSENNIRMVARYPGALLRGQGFGAPNSLANKISNLGRRAGIGYATIGRWGERSFGGPSNALLTGMGAGYGAYYGYTGSRRRGRGVFRSAFQGAAWGAGGGLAGRNLISGSKYLIGKGTPYFNNWASPLT